ncbi:MAG: hypothetical protein KF727_01730 [Microbacteriaceae bacterium]|nr:hypothetical protein [Microbacteriaceae bacterium]
MRESPWPEGPSRRSVVRIGATLGAVGVLGALAACVPEQTPTSSAGPTPTVSPTPAPEGALPRVLLAVFSRAGENYWNGGRRVLEVGNTDVVAGMIRDSLEVEHYRIEAADPYPFEYEPTVQRNWSEVQAGARPSLAAAPPGLNGIDTVLLGSPVWASQTPMIMRTFVEAVGGFAGLTVHPFVTYAVSGFGSVPDDYAALCPDATFGEGLTVRGENATGAAPEVRGWLARIGLI